MADPQQPAPSAPRVDPASICPRYEVEPGRRMCNHYFQAADKTGLCTLPEFFTCVVYMASHPERFSNVASRGSTLS